MNETVKVFDILFSFSNIIDNIYADDVPHQFCTVVINHAFNILSEYLVNYERLPCGALALTTTINNLFIKFSKILD